MSMKLTCGEFVGLAYANDDELREFAEEILAENAKLRELLSESLMDYKLYAKKYGLPPYLSDVNEHLDVRLRELGIEVDE